MQFYKYWSKESAHTSFLSTFPYTLSLGVDSKNKCLLPFHPKNILVTESYNNLFHRVLRLREADIGTTAGVVLTGQSGTGVCL